VLGKKKGTEESEVAIAVVIFVFVVATVVTFAQSEMVKVSAELGTVREKLEIIDAAHLVKDCFSGGNSTIAADFLEKNRGKRISRLCDINTGNIYVSVKDLEEGDEWVFGSGGSYSHSVFVSISNNGRINVGELNVKI
jgi:hypothetical protein